MYLVCLAKLTSLFCPREKTFPTANLSVSDRERGEQGETLKTTFLFPWCLLGAFQNQPPRMIDHCMYVIQLIS